MIKCDIDKGVGDIEISGDWRGVLLDIAILALHACRKLSDNDDEFEKMKKRLIACLLTVNRADVEEG